jgi:hypothetical protein
VLRRCSAISLTLYEWPSRSCGKKSMQYGWSFVRRAHSVHMPMPPQGWDLRAVYEINGQDRECQGSFTSSSVLQLPSSQRR